MPKNTLTNPHACLMLKLMACCHLWFLGPLCFLILLPCLEIDDFLEPAIQRPPLCGCKQNLQCDAPFDASVYPPVQGLVPKAGLGSSPAVPCNCDVIAQGSIPKAGSGSSPRNGDVRALPHIQSIDPQAGPGNSPSHSEQSSVQTCGLAYPKVGLHVKPEE